MFYFGIGLIVGALIGGYSPEIVKASVAKAQQFGLWIKEQFK